MKKLLLVILLLLGLTSCENEPIQKNKNTYTSKVIYKTTEINTTGGDSSRTYYVFLMENEDVVITDLPNWFNTQIGDSIYYEDYTFITPVYYHYQQKGAEIH